MKKIALMMCAVLALFTACDQKNDKFALSHSQVVLNAGDQIQVKASMGDMDVEAAWESADEAVATVEAGLITAVAVGNTTVTATYEGQTATVAVVVEQVVEDMPSLELPGEGKVTICVQVPAPLCEGSFVVIPGSLTSWDPGDAVANGQATQLVEGTTTWYAGTFDWGADKAFKVAHSKEDGTWAWNFQAAKGTLIEGDITIPADKGDQITGDNVINSDNQVIYVSVESWESSACVETNAAGMATFKLTPIGFPEGTQFAIAGSGLSSAWSCPPPAEYIMTAEADGTFSLTLEVPAMFQYKYLVSYDGGANWAWYSAANYNMPVSLQTDDIETYVAPEEKPAE